MLSSSWNLKLSITYLFIHFLNDILVYLFIYVLKRLFALISVLFSLA